MLSQCSVTKEGSVVCFGFSFLFLFMRIPHSLIISLVNRRNGRINFILGWKKEQQSEAVVLRRGSCSDEVFLQKIKGNKML